MGKEIGSVSKRRKKTKCCHVIPGKKTISKGKYDHFGTIREVKKI